MTNFVQKQLDPTYTDKFYGMKNTCLTILQMDRLEDGKIAYSFVVKEDSSHLDEPAEDMKFLKWKNLKN